MRRISVSVAGMLLSLALALPAYALVSRTPDASWQADARVNAIVRSGDRVFIGGRFTSLFDHAERGSVTRQHLAVLHATTGEPSEVRPSRRRGQSSSRLTPRGARSTSVAPSRRPTPSPGPASLPSRAGDGDTPFPFTPMSRGKGQRDRRHVRRGVHRRQLHPGGRAGPTPARGAGIHHGPELTAWYPGLTDGGDVKALSMPTPTRLVVGGSFTRLGGQDEPFMGAVTPVTAQVVLVDRAPEEAGHRGAGFVGRSRLRRDDVERGRPVQSKLGLLQGLDACW